MQIKKFRADDTAEALSQIRKEFGSRAVILSSKDVEQGAGVFGFRKKYCVEITAATDAEPTQTGSESGNGLVEKLSLKMRVKDSVAPVSLKRRSASHSRGEKNMNRVGRFKPAKLKGRFSRKTDHSMQFFGLYKELQDQGVKEHIAMDLVKELGRFSSLKRGFSAEDLKQGVVDILKKMGAVTKPIKIIRGEQMIAAMVGPTGVGKTTTIAKLAAVGGLKNGRKLGMITLDDKRIGAVQELEVYSRIFDVPMEVASTRRQLEQSLYNLRRKDVILIDTPGISRKENALLRRMQDLLQSVKSAEIHLLMSATTREKDFKTILNRFKVMNINKLIFTRLDDSTEYGDLLNQLIDTRIPASYFADGPQVPENIEVATLDRLVALILKNGHATKIAAPITPPRRENRKRLVYGPYAEKSYAFS
ncbi:MAG: flagellar biosynthesis protein FlhF [Deltaproteobacteria bacterium]|nr:flagellar biosynthesis protein FlhF [Deltaproteobacteria bacterium]